jgi:hypothetical protein
MSAKRVFVFLGVLIVIANLVWLNFEFYKLKSKPQVVTNQVSNCNTCPTPEPIVATETATPTPKSIVRNVVQVKKEKTVSYVPVTGTGQTLENKWTDLSGTDFYINTDDYPNIKEAYFEGSLRLFNGNGLAYARLMDVTAGVEVWGSDIQTSSQSFVTVVSGNLTLRSGKHLYRVQVKSLTADTAIFNSGRIKIIN